MAGSELQKSNCLSIELVVLVISVEFLNWQVIDVFYGQIYIIKALYTLHRYQPILLSVQIWRIYLRDLFIPVRGEILVLSNQGEITQLNLQIFSSTQHQTMLRILPNQTMLGISYQPKPCWESCQTKPNHIFLSKRTKICCKSNLTLTKINYVASNSIPSAETKFNSKY